MPAFTQRREVTINAAPARVHGMINDFHAWSAWSPWEAKDPDLVRTFTGPDAGVGSHYEWRGNKKVGHGSMEITSSTPDQITIALEFIEPFQTSNVTTFDLTPSEGGTRVVWTMRGERGRVMALFGKLFFDKAIAKDFDQGLASLKALAEG